jgi:hypothetical protein
MQVRVFALRHAECVMNTFPNRVGGRVVRIFLIRFWQTRLVAVSVCLTPNHAMSR